MRLKLPTSLENIVKRGTYRGRLEEKVAMWPTPRTSNPGSRPDGKGGKILSEEVLISQGIRKRGEEGSYTGWWDIEPDVGRVANGIPNRVDRLRCLGNSLIPDIPYYIGLSILKC